VTDHLLTKNQAFGTLAASHEPALRVKAGAGDRIVFETDDLAYAQMDRFRDMAKVTATLNPVTGPVYVEGAEPGDALAVTIHDIELAEQGWSVYIPGAGALARPMGSDMFVRRIPVHDGRAHLTSSTDCAVAPMIGCIGLAPEGVEASTVMPSYVTGGNMDLTDAAPGATVLLPVQVPGALLFIGDIHAVMSRGESSFVAIEIAGRATVSVDVVKDRSLPAPQIETPTEYVCVGLGNPVQDSIDMAYQAMFSILVDGHGWSKDDAYVVMSALAHTELGGPTGSAPPDPLHPFRPIGAVTLARLTKDLLSRRP
jgi:amidase